MTKKETAEMDALRDQLRIAKALRFTEEVKPDVPAPTYREANTTGYLFADYSGFGGDSTSPACSSSVHHNSRGNEKTTTQGARTLYSTRLLALRGLRHEVEQEVAQRLARIDRQIEQELAE